MGGAGHIVITESGSVGEVHLNFSGHYRPPLTPEYVCYAFRTLANHPLVSIERDCEILGRLFDEEAVRSSVIKFASKELITDDPKAQEELEMMLV